MKLLIIDDDLRAHPAPEIVLITEFNALIKRDKGSVGDYRGDKKLRATRELAYIYHCVDWNSPYVNYHFEIREERVREDVFKDLPGWEPDEVVEAAIKKYVELTTSPGVLMLNAGMKAAQKLTDFFESVDLTETDKNNRPVYSAKDLMTNLSNLGNVVEGLDKLREQVKKQQFTANKNRKSVETNQFSE